MATWENENKIHCAQTLLEGDGPKTYWTRELANDELILVRSGPLNQATSPDDAALPWAEGGTLGALQ